MKMKKIISALTAAVMIMIFAACGAGTGIQDGANGTGALDDGTPASAVFDTDITAKEATGTFEMTTEDGERRADIIIPEGGHNPVALEMITERVRAHLER